MTNEEAKKIIYNQWQAFLDDNIDYAGISEAYKMAILARGLGMKVMLGCMTETSCGIAAAAQLSPMVDWTDLDGNALIANDRFEGLIFEDGKVIPADKPGLGVSLIKGME